MTRLDAYIQYAVSDLGLSENELRENVARFETNVLNQFNKQGIDVALFSGHVQSGKTAQMLATIALSVDRGYKSFIVLTSSNSMLQVQTYKRCKSALSGLEVYDESEFDDFRRNGLRNPSVVVVKKNKTKLGKWVDFLKTETRFRQVPLIVFDDEADAESLNTKVNQSGVSTINGRIRQLSLLTPCTLFIQVTATPYANLLQEDGHLGRPRLSHWFRPGNKYLGGEYFYSDDSEGTELVPINEETSFFQGIECPSGLRSSLAHFIATSLILSRKLNVDTGNMLVHPGREIADHNLAEKYISGLLRGFSQGSLVDSEFANQIAGYLASAGISDWCDSEIAELSARVRVRLKNSDSDLLADDLKYGLSVVVGGNSLGRGITIPNLRTVYYIRNSRSPQADTVWQHSRVFGYDRVRGHVKVFLTRDLFILFRELSLSHHALFESICKYGVDGLVMRFPGGIRPTRTSVVNKSLVENIVGGVQYFLRNAGDKSTAQVDSSLGNANRNTTLTIDSLAAVLNTMYDPESNDESIKRWLSALRYLDPNTVATVCIRVDRDIKRDYRTVLSSQDNQYLASLSDNLGIFFYRINCATADWNGHGGPRWIPVIKFPNGSVYWHT